MRLSMLLLLLALGHAASSSDQQVLQDARDKVSEYCGKASFNPEINYEKGRKDLSKGAGEDNILFKILTESSSPDEMATVAQEELNVGFVVQKGWPIALCLVVLLIYAFCCWSACCPCCRCCRHQRTSSKGAKILAVLVFAVLVLGFVITTYLVFRGFQGVDDGVLTTSCSSAELLEDVLAGDAEMNFIGLLPVLKTFGDLVGNLEPSSSFMNGLSGILDRTQKIDATVALTGATLTLLRDMLDAPGNVNPKTGTGVDLMHECQFCKELSPILAPVADAIDQGVGTALVQARAEVQTQLNGPQLDELRTNLEASFAPLEEFKKTSVEAIGFFVTPGKFDTFVQQVQGTSSPLFFLVMYACLVFFLILLCACGSLTSWSCRGNDSAAYKRQSAHMLPCCAWCNAIIYSITVLFIGGLMVVISVPLSGMCLVMLDFDKELGQDIFRGLGVEGAEMNQVLDIADRCLSIKSASAHANASRNLLDIVKIQNSTGGEDTVRQQVVAQAIEPVNAQFDAVTAALESKPVRLSNMSELAKLRALLRDTPVEAMILPDSAKVLASTAYKALADDARTAVGIGASEACDDFTPAAELGVTSDIPGIETFFNSFKSMGVETPAGSCASRDKFLLSCNDAPLTTAGAACLAANRFLKEKKYRLATDGIFKCNLFKNPNGAGSCDPKDMSQDANGVWQNSCLDSEGRVEVFARSCNLEEFSQYLADFDERFKNVFQFLDSTVENSLSAVNTELRDHVTEYVLTPIYDVVDQFDCSFMSNFWEGLINGMCFEAINGFRLIANSYVISAVCCLILAFMMYLIWRVAKDNIDTFKPETAI